MKMSISKKKIALIAFIIINFLLGAMMHNRFDPNEINLDLERPYKGMMIDSRMMETGTEVYSVHYITRVARKEVVYVEGNDRFFSKEPLVNGRWLDFGDVKKVLISKDIAESQYKTYECLGQTFNFNNKVYKIVGILDTDNKIMMSYSEGDERNGILKTVLNVKFDGFSDVKLDNIIAHLSIEGIQIQSIIVYEWFVEGFRTIGIIMLALLILKSIYDLILPVYREMQALWEEYKKRKMVFEITKYVGANKAELLRCAANVIVSVVLFLVLGPVVKGLSVPSIIIPSDLTSIKDYIAILESLMNGLMYQTAFGMKDIVVWFIGFGIVQMVFGGMLLVAGLNGKSVSEKVKADDSDMGRDRTEIEVRKAIQEEEEEIVGEKVQ